MKNLNKFNHLINQYQSNKFEFEDYEKDMAETEEDKNNIITSHMSL